MSGRIRFRRQWFRSEDGRYYRNFSLMEAEYYDALRKGRFQKAHRLAEEVREHDGVHYTDRIGRRDTVVEGEVPGWLRRREAPRPY